MVEDICERYGLKVYRFSDNMYVNESVDVEVNCHKLLHELKDKILLVSDTIRKERDNNVFTSKIAFLYYILDSNTSKKYILECFSKAKQEYGSVFIMVDENLYNVNEIPTIDDMY